LEHEEIKGIVFDELHIKQMALMDELTDYVVMKAVPAYPVLGKRFGKRVPEVVKAIEGLGQAAIEAFQRDGVVVVKTGDGDVQLGRDELNVKVSGVQPYGAHQERGVTVALNLEIDETLRIEGVARELINRLQNLRKKIGLEVSDRIEVRYHGGEIAGEVFEKLGELIRTETLATRSAPGEADWEDSVDFDVDGENIRLWVRRESD
jgi:isoleucyl-tRNA synthetase